MEKERKMERDREKKKEGETDPVRIAAERGNVLVDPLQGESLILNANVGIELVGVEVAEDAQAIVGDDEDRVGGGGDVGAVVHDEGLASLL